MSYWPHSQDLAFCNFFANFELNGDCFVQNEKEREKGKKKSTSVRKISSGAGGRNHTRTNQSSFPGKQETPGAFQLDFDFVIVIVVDLFAKII